MNRKISFLLACSLWAPRRGTVLCPIKHCNHTNRDPLNWISNVWDTGTGRHNSTGSPAGRADTVFYPAAALPVCGTLLALAAEWHLIKIASFWPIRITWLFLGSGSCAWNWRNKMLQPWASKQTTMKCNMCLQENRPSWAVSSLLFPGWFVCARRDLLLQVISSATSEINLFLIKIKHEYLFVIIPQSHMGISVFYFCKKAVYKNAIHVHVWTLLGQNLKINGKAFKCAVPFHFRCFYMCVSCILLTTFWLLSMLPAFVLYLIKK